MASNALPANDLTPAAPSRRLTINDIAYLAGVSKKTVSRVINNEPKVRAETRAKVQGIILRTGYVPDPQARALAHGRSSLIGMIYEPWRAPAMMQMPAGMLAALAGTGYEMIIRPCSLCNPSVLADLRNFVQRQRLIGLVLTPPISDDPRVLGLLDEIGCAYVRITAEGGADGVVDTQDHQCGRIAAEHLAGLGHRRLGLVGAPANANAAARAAGFKAALAEQGVELDPEYIIAASGLEGGHTAGLKLLALDPRPTAVFADSDELAAGILRAIAEAGLAPGALAVMGYGDRALGQVVSPSLTTIRPMTWTVGAQAVRRLIGAPDMPGESPLPVLVARASTSAPI